MTRRIIAVIVLAMLAGVLIQVPAYADGGGTVTGIVTGSDGQPANGASVEIRNSQGVTQGSAVSTDPSGFYTVTVAAGNWFVHAFPPGGSQDVPSNPRPVTVVDAQTTANNDVILQEATVTGHVYEPSPSTTGVNMAYVDVYDISNNLVTSGMTDNTGAYRLAVPSGGYNIKARPPFGVQLSDSTSTGLNVPNPFVTPVVVDLSLQPGGNGGGGNQGQPDTFDGILYEPGSSTTPVVNARVGIRQGFQEIDSTNTASDGTFHLGGPTGTYELSASAPDGSSLAAASAVTVVLGQSGVLVSPDPLVVHLNTANVSGHVYEPGGSTPVANAYVQASTMNFSFNAQGNTSSDGSYHLYVPPSNSTYQLSANPPFGSSFGQSLTAVLTVPNSGPATATPSLDLHLQVLNVMGRVLEPGSSTTVVPNASVFMNSSDFSFNANGQTDQNGDFAMAAPPGTYSLTANPPQDSAFAGSAPVTVVIGNNGTVTSPNSLDIHLSQPNVSGHVYEPGNNTPVQNANVQVRSSDYSFFTNAQTNSSGAFHLNVSPGSYFMSAEPPWGNSTFTRSAEVPLNIANDGTVTSPNSLNIHLSTPNVSGTIVDPNGDPVGDTNVQVRSADYRFQTQAQAANDGVFRLNLPLGTYVISANPPGGDITLGRSADVTFTVSSDGSVSGLPAELALRTPNVTGQVLQPGSSSTGIAGANVYVRSATNFSFNAYAQGDNTGHFGMTLAPGTYIFTGDPGQSSAYSSSVDTTVVVPQSGTINVSLHTTTPNVSGVVRGPSPSTAGLANINLNIRSVDKPNFYNAQTDNTGNYHLSLPAGEYVVSANPQQGSTLTASVDTTLNIPTDNATATLDLRLTEPNISGIVLASDGSTPVESSDLSLQNNDTGFYANTRTDANGEFHLFAPPGTYFLRASAPSDSTDAASVDQEIVVAGNGTGPSNVQLQLTQANVTGIVLQPGTSSQRVGNVNVSMHTTDWSTYLNAQADEEGNFRFNAPEGDYVVTAEPPFGNAQYGRSLDVAVTVPASGVVSVTTRLTNPNVAGTVYLPNGDAVANANVSIRSDDNSFFTNAQSDSEGTFRVTVPAAGSYIAVADPPQGNSLSASAPITLTVNGDGVLTSPVPLNLTLSSPSLVGQVFDPGATGSTNDDVIAGNGYVNLHNDDFSVQVGAQVRQDGRFSIGGIAPGTYTLEVSPPWKAAGLLRTSFSVTVGSGGTPVTVENVNGTGRVYLDVATENITVAVKRADNTSITSGARVQAFNENGGFVEDATPDGSGNYSLMVADGNWNVSVVSTLSANTWVFTERSPQVDSASCSGAPCVTLHVEQAGATVTGTVLRPNGTPTGANTAYVDVRTPDGRGSGTSVGSNGIFTVRVPAGTYNVTVHPNDNSIGSPPPRSVTVAANGTTDVGNLQMVARTSHIQGRVAFVNPDPNAAPTPVANAEVFAFMPNGGGFADARTQSDGTFTLNVIPGDWQVGIWSKPTDNWLNEDPLQSVAVLADDTTTGVNFDVSASAATVRGQALLPGGTIAPVDGFVSLTSASGNGGGGAPLNNGSFAVPSRAGTYTVKLFLAPGSPYTAPNDQTVIVAPNGTVTPSSVTLQLIANDQQLSGQVVDTTGNAVASGNVVVSASRNGFYTETRTDNTGHYQLLLASGTWQLATRSDDPNYSVTGFRLANNSPAAISTAVATVTLGGGTSTIRNIAVVPAARAILGTVRDSGGSALEGVWVRIDSSGDAVVPIHTGAYTDASGNFSINVPDGTYEVGASGGPAGQLEPEAVRVSVSAANTPAPLALSFRASTSTISGVVRMASGGAPVSASVQAWSNSGGYITADSDPTTGAYVLNVTENDVWHLTASVADATNASRVLVADEVLVTVAGASQTNVMLELSAITVPNGVRATFDASTAQVVELGGDTPSPFDDVTITVPAGALATTGSVSLVATPNAGPNETRGTHPVGLGYDFEAFDASGVPILNTFNRALTITFGYDPDELTATGLDVTDLVPSFWDPTSRTYRRTDTAVVDTSTHTITFTTEHFTQWVIAAAVTTPGIPTTVAATAASGSATITWAAPADTGGSTITGYTVTASPGGASATTSGTVRTAALSGLSNGTSYTFTVRATNAMGTGVASAVSNAVTPAVASTGGGTVPDDEAATDAGYRLVGKDGAIYTFGTSASFGSPTGGHLAAPVVGGATTPSNNGYWFVAADGGVFAYGDAGFYGSTGGMKLNKPIVGMSATPSGFGYWLVASDGGVFAYGDAKFFGSAGSIKLNKPVVGMTSTPTGLGYWLVASDGGIFAYGDAVFYGSAGSITLNKPVVGMTSSPTGKGYWLVASDGGIFSYGDSTFLGSAGSITLNKPIVAMKSTTAGDGYTLVASDGGVFTYGLAPFFGSAAGNNIAEPVVGLLG